MENPDPALSGMRPKRREPFNWMMWLVLTVIVFGAVLLLTEPGTVPVVAS
ncbi:MAG: hypothetical protein AB7I36_07195 [Rhodospirillaceae bacterium]